MSKKMNWIYEKVKAKKTLPSNRKVIILQKFHYRSEHRFFIISPAPRPGVPGRKWRLRLHLR
jgi:hypothetical protein